MKLKEKTKITFTKLTEKMVEKKNLKKLNHKKRKKFSTNSIENRDFSFVENKFVKITFAF